jgi:hypothetical protein
MRMSNIRLFELLIRLRADQLARETAWKNAISKKANRVHLIISAWQMIASQGGRKARTQLTGTTYSGWARPG